MRRDLGEPRRTQRVYKGGAEGLGGARRSQEELGQEEPGQEGPGGLQEEPGGPQEEPGEPQEEP